jgi:outer membrane immunogenic protein
MRFKIIGVAAALLLLASFVPAGAQAQSMVSGVDWSGFYAGASGGAGSSNTKVTGSQTAPTATTFPIDVAAVSAANSPSITLTQGYLGAQGGYNWQFGNIVAGLETDFGGLMGSSGSGGTFQFPSTLPGGPLGPPAQFFSTTTSVSNGWLITARPRIGFGWNNWLFYGTGGLAAGRENVRQTTNLLNGAVETENFSKTQVGWAAGAGLEYALAPGWSVKAEYLHMDLGSTSTVAGSLAPPTAGFAYAAKASFTSDMARIGFNYHFAPPPPPPPAPMAMPAPPPAAPKVFIVFFDWDKDVVTPEGQQIIQQAADAYRSGAPVQLQVTGYTDRSGSPGYNQRLSERRANNVARALAALGVPKNEMVVSGRGENDNRVPTAPGVREPQNRRVEIVAP